MSWGMEDYLTLRTQQERRRAMLDALRQRLEKWRDKPGENYPLDVVERELILEALDNLRG
jgi:hypothetical protein